MNQDEKAIELFDKFMGFKMRPYKDPEMTLSIGRAKRNAIIACDEIIKEGKYLGVHRFEYWQEVKQEIEKL